MIRIRHITGSAELAPKGQPGSWVSEVEREKFMVAYERAFELWPQPYEEFDIETATATTRVHAYRPPRRAHQARRPLLVVVLHRRPGLHDPIRPSAAAAHRMSTAVARSASEARCSGGRNNGPG
jgi:hypothetical protein